MRKPFGLRRLVSGPELGLLFGLGFGVIIVIATFCRMVVAIVQDVLHSSENTKRKDNSK